MSVWNEDPDTFMGLSADFVPWCFFHRDLPHIMQTVDAKLLNFKLHPDDSDEPWSYATDVVNRCPYCGVDDIYGVAITPEHHDRQWKRIEFFIFKNIVRRFWKRDPLLVVKGFISWIRRRLTLKQPSR
jgi:hypothetical protein